MDTKSACAKCAKPLTLEYEDDADDDEQDIQTSPQESYYPDDVKLSCSHHFHWECLLDAYEYTNCSKCNRSIVSRQAGASSSSSSSQEQIIVDLNNEGGLQEGIDIMPLLKEESYLRAYPEEQKCRAFLEFCREGDHRAVAELLKSCREDGDAEDDDIDVSMDDEPTPPTKSMDDILRYQDPIGDSQSGLHAAAQNGHREVAWLLLLLASDYPELEFPPLVFQEAGALDLMREGPMDGKVDIRRLRDAQGRSAEDIAKVVGVIWHGWIGNGRLTMPDDPQQTFGGAF
ncbi:hypothetical protein LTR62_000856 [Meristemomyces frigidus]|uniref:RING-type domain-containing protein n=1 Tax=Meristemomyces frigidus TaxID=1508187 RepID=A0AAN7YIJ1_9PEZI|nr:hypothetical protein LTR62_000856 [Meristemomyces frigidus]